jgi:hypothetical protein
MPTEIPVSIQWRGMEIRVEKMLAGCKYAILFGDGPVLVSPAMMDLISHANPDELKLLLENISIRCLPPMLDFINDPIPMLTRWDT